MKFRDHYIKPLPKVSKYVKTLKDKNGNKDNKLMSFCIDDENLLKNI